MKASNIIKTPNQLKGVTPIIFNLKTAPKMKL
jgi:hypothetical protein